MSGAGSGCYFDAYALAINSVSIMNNPVVPCENSGIYCTKLKYDSSDGSYGYSNSVNNSIYTRVITTENNGNNYKVTSTVYWIEKGTAKNVSFSSDLYNWIEA